MEIYWGEGARADGIAPAKARIFDEAALPLDEDAAFIAPKGRYSGKAIAPKGAWVEIHPAHDVSDPDHAFWASDLISVRVGLLSGIEVELAVELASNALANRLPPDTSPAKILIINGPNLNLLGRREPEIYGVETLSDIAARVEKIAPAAKLSWKQSNSEGEIIEFIQSAEGDGQDAIIINAAAFTHSSIAIHDALKSFGGKVAEVHISNPHQREPFRHKSYISPVADMLIAGFGANGYVVAVLALLKRL